VIWLGAFARVGFEVLVSDTGSAVLTRIFAAR